MSVGHHGSSSPNGTPSLRAVDPPRGSDPHPGDGLNSDSRNDCTLQPVRAERTVASDRAEQAYRDWNSIPNSQKPLATAHEELWKSFDRIIHERWLKDTGAYTNEAIARRCGIDEKGVRQWRDGAKRLPAAAFMVLPPSIAIDTIQWISERRGLGRQQRAVAVLADVVTRVEQQSVAPEDRDETLRALIDAQSRIAARIAALAVGGR